MRFKLGFAVGINFLMNLNFIFIRFKLLIVYFDVLNLYNPQFTNINKNVN